MFCDKLRELRRQNNLKQSDLAQILHVGTSTVSGWEIGKYLPDINILSSLCDYFQVPADYLLGRSESLNDTSFISQSQVNQEQAKVLNYYDRLDEENRDYIRGTMVKLIKEQDAEKKRKKEIS